MLTFVGDTAWRVLKPCLRQEHESGAEYGGECGGADGGGQRRLNDFKKEGAAL